MCSTSIYLVLTSFHMIQGAEARWKMAPTVLSTRTQPRLGGRPSRSASRKIWSSAGWSTREESAVIFSDFLLLFSLFWFQMVVEREHSSAIYTFRRSPSYFLTRRVVPCEEHRWESKKQIKEKIKVTLGGRLTAEHSLGERCPQGAASLLHH